MKFLEYFSIYNYSDIFREFDRFLKSDIRNVYIEDAYMIMYVRKSKRSINRQLYDFIDIANISIERDMRDKGVFTNFISELLNRYPDFNILVENIFNPAVVTVLSKFGFERKDGPDNTWFLLRKR